MMARIFGAMSVHNLRSRQLEKAMFNNPQESIGTEAAGCAAGKLGTAEIRPKRRFGRATEGQGLVELALILPMFLILIFATIDFGHLFWVELTLQNAVRQAARYAITGNHLPDPSKPGHNLSRVGSIIQVAQQTAVGLDVSNLQISSLTGGTGSAGGPGDTMTVSLTTSMPLITPLVGKFFKNGVYTFTVSVTMRNEPFSPSETA